jgi:hypothetical protein
MATLNDPIVKLANYMILIAEDQIQHGTHAICIEKKNQSWMTIKA